VASQLIEADVGEVLDQVKTLPEHHRKGAGTALLRWGVELADREGLPIRLEATPYGLGLYEKFGFETKEKVELDLRPWGGTSYTFTIMLREPVERGKTSTLSWLGSFR
jgi:GNAT superfamily N-acetyltransferase